MKKKISTGSLILLILTMAYSPVVMAQNPNTKFGNPTNEELTMTSYAPDESAPAVILYQIPVYSEEKEDREYSQLYLYPMELSEEIKYSIDDYIHCYTKEIRDMHYLEISIFEIYQDSVQVHFGIKLINSPDKNKLVINEEHLGFGMYEEIEPIYRYVGYSYYNKHWIIVSKWYQLHDICNPFIKKSPFPFVKEFLLWKHEVIPHVGGDNSRVCFIVKKNYIYKCPPMIEE